VNPKPLVDQLAERIMSVYHAQGESAAIKLRDELIAEHKLTTMAYVVLGDKMRALR
jgi:hypothetical protein